MVTHMRIVNERSGNPIADNRSRNSNKYLSRLRSKFVVRTPRGRKRKKQLTKETYLQYVTLWLAVYNDIAEKAKK